MCAIFCGDKCGWREDARILSYMFNACVLGKEGWAYRYNENTRAPLGGVFSCDMKLCGDGGGLLFCKKKTKTGHIQYHKHITLIKVNMMQISWITML